MKKLIIAVIMIGTLLTGCSTNKDNPKFFKISYL